MIIESKIRSFTDLRVWQKGHQLVLEIYKMTKQFPKEELFGLTSQIRRAIVSFTSNIAEGFSRHSYKEKIQFYFMALGSLTEVQNQLFISRDLSYVDKESFQNIINQTTDLNKMLTGLIKSSKIRIS